MVKKGNLLAKPRPFQTQLDQAIANRDRDQAQLGNAQANLNRYTPLAKNGWASTQLVDTTKAQVAQLRAMVKNDEGVIEQAKVNLSYAQLRSPIDADQACLVRFRPILMTTMAALLGGVPLMLGTGNGAEIRQPLGYAIVGGLFLSQVLTLFTTPVVYVYLDRLQHLFKHRSSHKAEAKPASASA